MKDNCMVLKLKLDDLNPFVAYLTLGVLYSIQTKTVSSNVGIWSIGRPNFFKPLQNFLPKEIYEVLEMCDELSALEKLDPGAFEQDIQEMIDVLTTYLKKNGDPNFLAQWNKD